MSDMSNIKDLAVAVWRLEKWLDNLKFDRKMAAKSAIRSIKKFITDSNVDIRDPIGSKFDPGLAMEVVNNEADGVEEEKLIIIETLTPYVFQNGELIQHARVIIGTVVKETKVNNDIKDKMLSESEMKAEYKKTNYPSDLSDEQWKRIEEFFPTKNRSKYHKRNLVEAAIYVTKTNCHWRALPHDYPPYKTVCNFYNKAKKKGAWDIVTNEISLKHQ